MINPSTPFIRWLQFLGKVQFTTILLLGGVIIMTIGTILESRGSREVAWSAVYGTVWFDIFLFLIAVNLVIAVINRIPIRRHQWPFVLTHFAIVILLAGAWISRTYGFEGRMFIYEGSRESQIYLDGSEIQARWPNPSGATTGGEVVEINFSLPLHGRLEDRVLREEDESGPGIRIAEFIPDGVVEFQLSEGGDGDPPGIVFLLTSGEHRIRQWLIAGDPRFGRKDFGSVEVEFRQAELSGIHPDAGATVHIAPRDGANAVHIPLPARVGVEVPIGAGLVARVQEYFQRALVLEDKLTEAATGPPNPAAIIEIRAQNQREIHTVFANYPDFGTIDGRELERPLVEAVKLELPDGPKKPRITALLGPGDQLRLQLSGPTGMKPSIPAVLGRNELLAGFGLRLDRLIANANTEIGVTPAPPGSTGSGKHVRLEATANGMRQSLWLDHTDSFRKLHLNGSRELALAFGPQKRELPFSIALEEFELIRYPGSSQPSEYRSRVRVEPAAADIPAHDAIISMNRPLDVSDFRLFQSSYKLGEAGEPDATILSVAYDPGVPIVYTSFLLLILGIAWGLRGVSHKLEHPIHTLATRDAATAPAFGFAQTERRERIPTAQRAGARNLALLFAMLVGLTAGLDAHAQRAADPAISRAPLPVDATRGWAIVADGRVKPLITYAKEITLAVTGRERLDGLSALEIFWGYSLNSQDFMDRSYVRVDGIELKEKLGLSADQKRFSFNTLLRTQSFQQLVEQALARRQRDQELSRLEDDALETYGKLQRLAALASGEALTIVPIVDASGGWATPAGLAGSAVPGTQAVSDGFAHLAAAYTNGDAESFGRQAEALTIALRNVNPAVYPAQSVLERELFYEDFNAFGKAWVLYLAGFLAILLFGFSDRPWGYLAGMTFITAGFICHSVGLGTRWLIADRAPVSNMYESLVFMGWGAIAIGLIPEIVYRKRFLALAAGLMGFVCLAFSENLPIDPAINPLVPVLAHTYWLSVHVMTVMLSYSAFAIAMVLGHVMLLVELVFQRQRVGLLTSLSKLLYKTLQVGVLFLAAGIIFGAIWANESWGRYWGWDPKETWSLITFFVYLAIIHARFAGWLRHFGLAASAILGFLAVVMTYYGVNFILAAGMHAYGFSEGGQLYVGLYAAAELAIIGAAWFRYGNVKTLPSGPIDEPA